MDIKRYVEILPKPLKQSLRYAYGLLPARLRFGKVFWDTYNFLQESQWWSREKLEQYQLEQLEKLLNHAYKNVPYYRRVFDERGLKPGDIQSIEDLRKLPFLTKEIIRKNKEKLKAANFHGSAFSNATTGGSSGDPFGFYNQVGYSNVRERAFIYSLWSRVGFHESDKRLVLRGSTVKNDNKIEYNPTTKEIICSIYDMDENHLFLYFKKMKEEHVKYIHGHVSSIVIFANFLIRNNLSHNLRAVFGASEKVFPFQREIIKKAFNTRLFSWYGQSEQVVLAGECERSSLYHVFPEYGVLELIDEDGNNIYVPGQSGEIVGTSFNNYVMPFIRYRTGDVAKYSSQKCNCGREYDLLEDIEGRSYEYIVTKCGNKISLTGLIFGQHFEAFEHIERMQIYQDKQGAIEIRIVKLQGYSKRDEIEIDEIIKKAVGPALSVKFNYVKNIPLTARGKHRFLIQKLIVKSRY